MTFRILNLTILVALVSIFSYYATGQSYSCKNTAFKITCQPQQEIIIHHACYGKASNSTNCQNNKTDSTACYYLDATAAVAKKCDSKQNCTIFVNATDFPDDPCPNIVKYLTVNYSCEFEPPNPNITCDFYDHKVANTTTCTDSCPGFNCTSKRVPYACICDYGFLRDPITNTCVDSAFCPKAGDPLINHQKYSSCAARRQIYCCHTYFWRLLPRSWRCQYPFGRCHPGYICQRGYFWDSRKKECFTDSMCSRMHY